MTPDLACHWLVQATVRGETRDRLERACAENGKPFYRVSIVPFSVEMPEDMPDIGDVPFVFYGYTTLILNAFHSPRWRRGIFFDPDIFRPSVYCREWGKERMLNDDAQFLTMEEFAKYPHTLPTTPWFIKPDDDLKRFTGCVMTHREFCDWYVGTEKLGGEGDIGSETRILIAEPKALAQEWRGYVVGTHIVAKSCYSNDGRELPLPPEVERFACDAISHWEPAPAFALDVTINDAGEPRLIEANCINGSGLYQADTAIFVRALSRWQELAAKESAATICR